MTFRAKPVVKRAHRPSWEAADRRNMLLNIGFGIVVVAAVLILVIAAALSWYNDHLVSVGSVAGQSITKDDLRDRFAIETWRLDEAERRIRTQVVSGHLTEAQAQVQAQVIEQQRQQLEAIALERIIDNRIQAGLAATEGVSATEGDIDARLAEEATTPENRHAWVIEVEPEIADGATEPTAEQKATAKTKADQALADIKGGKSWDDVAKTVSTDASTAPQAGDLGWLQGDDSQADEPYLRAIFAAAANEPTAVIEGDDGIFRIGRVTEIAPESVDANYQAKLTNDGIELAKYRAVVAGDVIRKKLEDKVVAEATKPSPQRHVQEIYVTQSDPGLADAAVKVRHILYSPKDDPESAAGGDIPETDPSWAKAETDAKAAYEKVKADPSLFDATARSESDEASATGPTGSGGKLPYFDAESGIDQAFKDAIFKPGLADGDILEPFKSAFGWHLVQIMYHPTDLEHLKEVKTEADGGADFALLARDTSESETASTGGDIGWVAKGQLDEALTDAIFAAQVGKTTEPVVVEDDGTYLYKVLAEETRTPEGRQLEQIRAGAFDAWYQPKKEATEITRAGEESTPAETG